VKLIVTFLFSTLWGSFIHADTTSAPAQTEDSVTPIENTSPEPEPDPFHVLSNSELLHVTIPDMVEDDDDTVALHHAMMRKEIIETRAAHLPFVILPHRPNYFMPFAYSHKPDNEPFEKVLPSDFNNVEAIFQVSIKYQIGQLDNANKHRIYVAYTNKSFWQVYNDELSSPFRETNHEPELILQIEPDWKYVSRINIGFNHQSNGQYAEFSRSWNRIVAGFYHASGNNIFGIEPWWRIPEKSSDDPNDVTDDDNPDIESYIGYGNFVWYKKLGRQSLSLRFGNNLDTDNNRGWAELEWDFPISSRFRAFVQYYEGYGHSLIEYDHYQRRIGIGFKISDWL
jgi:phospholipase A1